MVGERAPAALDNISLYWTGPVLIHISVRIHSERPLEGLEEHSFLELNYVSLHFGKLYRYVSVISSGTGELASDASRPELLM